jgi:hypothetical protein
MAQITVTHKTDGAFHVQTSAGTSHDVTVPAGFPASLGCSHHQRPREVEYLNGPLDLPHSGLFAACVKAALEVARLNRLAGAGRE